VSGPSDAFSVTGVAGGLLDETGEAAVLRFEAAGGALSLVMPAAELNALLSVCVGLCGQKLPEAGEAEHPTIPVADWRVGVTSAPGLALALAPEAGGALAFHLRPDQARQLADALTRALAALEARSSAPGGRH
jgi:hypothetical protein